MVDGLGFRGVDTELAYARQVVLDSESRDELAASDFEDVDLVDLLEAASGGGDAEPLAPMRARTSEVRDHLVAFCDQIGDLHLEVRERALKRLDPAFGRLREVSGCDLVEHLEVVPADSLPSQPAHQLLVFLRRQRVDPRGTLRSRMIRRATRGAPR